MNILATAANAVLIQGGAVLGAAFRQGYLIKSKHGRRVSERCLKRIVRTSKNTAFGRSHGFAGVRTVRDYQDLVPLTTYADYEDYVNRTLQTGEQGLLTGRKIIYFAETSGTTGRRKFIPQTLPMLLPYFKGACLMANSLVHTMRERGVPSLTARELFLLVIGDRSEPDPDAPAWRIPAGIISSFGAGSLSWFLPLVAAMPGVALSTNEISDTKYVRARYGLADADLKFIVGSYMSLLTDLMSYIQDNHRMLADDIERGTIDPSVAMSDRMRTRLERKLRPDPKRAAELRRVFDEVAQLEEGTPTRLISRLWRHLSFVSAVGTGEFAPFGQAVRSMCDDDVRIGNSGYIASEGVMGCGMRRDNPSYLLLVDTGFYEFLPIPEECEHMPARPLLMHELEVGKHYEIIITNRAGLYRYRIHDVILVTGFEGDVPYFDFAYRDTFVTDVCASHITGEQLVQAANDAQRAIDVPIVEYSLYGDAEHHKPRLELFVEMERALSEAEHDRLEQAFEEGMTHYAFDYAWFRDAGVMDRPVVREVAQGTYRRHRLASVEAGTSANQIKALRSINTPERLEFFRSATIR